MRLNPSIAEEVQEAFGLEIPACPNWTSVNIHHKLLRIIGMVSGRVFIGPELCRSEQYLDAAINYTLEVMAVQKAVSKMRPWLRPFLARRLPQLKTLEERIARAHEFIDPVVKLRKEAAADPSFEKPDDLLQWLLDVKDKFPDANSQNLTKVQLGATFAAIHTTVLAATNALVSPKPDLSELSLTMHTDSTASRRCRSWFPSSARRSDRCLRRTVVFSPATRCRI